jgi:glycosyltransferase involved in cell wall biosynthesis
MEFVLTHEEISKHRYFQAEDASESVLHATNLNTSSEGDLYSSPGGNHRLTAETTRPGGSNGTLPQNICLFNGPKLDGQKQIWYQQSKHMDPARFHFIWLLAEGAAGDPTVHFIAVLPHISVGANPALPVAVDELAEAPADGSAPASELWAGNTTYLFFYAHQRLVAANYTVDEVTPVWCRRMYVTMREAMLRHSCEVVVYGNTRGFSSDVVVTDTARVLGIPLVAELLNLYMHELVLPDVVVAPSQFALQHHSMRKITGGGDTCSNGQVSGTEQLSQCPCTPPRMKSPEMVVIPPSIDTGRFSREMVLEHEIYHHPACKVHISAVMRTGNESGHWPCVVIGFVARLSPGNCTCGSWLCRPFSYTLPSSQRRVHPFARFTVVGDGALRASLEDLAARLQISWAVHFAGWVAAEQLPALLAGLDIVVNPGLVLETFCIANAEALSMELPLVTFAVGGVGEYVAQPTQQQQDEQGQDFSVSDNAVVVHRATPAALASAVLHLVHSPELRRSLGQAGRRTVEARLSVARQIGQYAGLYEGLRRRW